MFIKEKKGSIKVIIGVLILTGLFTTIYIAVNNIAFVAATTDENLNNFVVNEHDITVETDEFEEDGWFVELENLEPIPHIVSNGFHSIQANQVILLNLATGQPIKVYDFDEYDVVTSVLDFGNNYYGAWVSNEDLWTRSWRLGLELPEDHDFSYHREHNLKLVIFDHNLVPIDTLYMEEELSLFAFDLNKQNTVFENGELITTTASWVTGNYQRINIHTGEIEVLVENLENMNIMSLINQDQAIVESWTELENAELGILNFQTGEVAPFEIQDFLPNTFILNETTILVKEYKTCWNWRNTGVTDRIMIIDSQSFEIEMIQLEKGDGRWAQPSYDENHIVTVNENESVFRKYDLLGNVVAETGIFIPFNFRNDLFEILPINDEVYAIHIHTSLFDSGRHIQMVNINGDNHVISPDDHLLSDVHGIIAITKLRTPEAHHLVEKDAKEIGAQLIFEEFGTILDLNAIDQNFYLDFEHENLGTVPRSFWVGQLDVLDLYDYDYWGNLVGTLLSSYTFIIDGVTGEKLGIRDTSMPIESIRSEIQWNDINIGILDESESKFIFGPSFTVERQPYHLTPDEAAIKALENIYDEFEINLDGHELIMSFQHWWSEISENYTPAAWSVNITRPDESFTEGFQLLFRVQIDATTGELLNITDMRDFVGQGTNNRIENREIILNNIQITAKIRIMGQPQQNQLTVEEIAQISVDAIYEEFGVNLDGLFISMVFLDGWSVTVSSQAEGGYMFQLSPDAITGDFDKIFDLRGVENPQ